MSHYLVLAGLMVSLITVIDPTRVTAGAHTLQITSPVISDGATIPAQFTCSGANQSPPLSFSGIPQGTKSLALLVEDPDAPGGTFVHWVVYDIPPSSHGFKPEAVAGKEGANSMGKAAYMGPCPPPGEPHHYHFRLFALDMNLNLEADANAQAVHDAMNGHILESTELVGIFGR
jgi:Raf kinase inhibitor-like YbhB/YbcL family protein